MSSQVSHHVVVGLLVGALLWSCPLGAASAQNQGTRVFRAEVELVVIEVTAVDKKGEPVRNLTKEDFEVLEDGKPRPIESFHFVEVKPDVFLRGGGYGNADHFRHAPARGLGAEAAG